MLGWRLFQQGQNHLCFKSWEEKRFRRVSKRQSFADQGGPSKPWNLWTFGLSDDKVI
ncbi:uncharacterized protein BDZ83DRAFT_616292, partial [Colletotrichum acutatum]